MPRRVRRAATRREIARHVPAAVATARIMRIRDPFFEGGFWARAEKQSRRNALGVGRGGGAARRARRGRFGDFPKFGAPER